MSNKRPLTEEETINYLPYTENQRISQRSNWVWTRIVLLASFISFTPQNITLKKYAFYHSGRVWYWLLLLSDLYKVYKIEYGLIYICMYCMYYKHPHHRPGTLGSRGASWSSEHQAIYLAIGWRRGYYILRNIRPCCIINPPPLQLEVQCRITIFVYKPTKYYKPTPLFRANVWG